MYRCETFPEVVELQLLLQSKAVMEDFQGRGLNEFLTLYCVYLAQIPSSWIVHDFLRWPWMAMLATYVTLDHALEI